MRSSTHCRLKVTRVALSRLSSHHRFWRSQTVVELPFVKNNTWLANTLVRFATATALRILFVALIIFFCFLRLDHFQSNEAADNMRKYAGSSRVFVRDAARRLHEYDSDRITFCRCDLLFDSLS